MEKEILRRNLASGFKLQFDSRDSAGTLLKRLLNECAITADQYALAERIVRLCNAAVHATRVSKEEAETVIEAAEVLTKDYRAWLSWGFDDNWTPQESRTR